MKILKKLARTYRLWIPKKSSTTFDKDDSQRELATLRSGRLRTQAARLKRLNMELKERQTLKELERLNEEIEDEIDEYDEDENLDEDDDQSSLDKRAMSVFIGLGEKFLKQGGTPALTSGKEKTVSMSDEEIKSYLNQKDPKELAVARDMPYTDLFNLIKRSEPNLDDLTIQKAIEMIKA